MKVILFVQENYIYILSSEKFDTYLQINTPGKKFMTTTIEFFFVVKGCISKSIKMSNSPFHCKGKFNLTCDIIVKKKTLQ